MTLAAKLYQDGKLDLDAPIQDYLPTFPLKTYNGIAVTMTTRHLASHTSGLPDYPKSFQRNQSFKNVSSSIGIFEKYDLVSEPGYKYNYSCPGWVLVSAIVEKVGNAPFSDQMHHMLQSLRMYSTMPDSTETFDPKITRYYFHDHEHHLVEALMIDNSFQLGSGGYVSSVEDMLTFGNTMLKCYQQPTSSRSIPMYLSSETMKLLWSPVVDRRPNCCIPRKYGLGWMVEPNEETDKITNSEWTAPKYICHQGGGIGHSSNLTIVPMVNKQAGLVDQPSGIVVAILTNSSKSFQLDTKLPCLISNQFLESVKA